MLVQNHAILKILDALQKEFNIKTELQTSLDKLTNNSNDPAKQKEIFNDIKKIMALDDLNTTYFISLYKSFVSKNQDSYSLCIHEKDRFVKNNEIEIYPTAIATDTQLSNLPYVQYSDLVTNEDSSISKKAALWIKKMQAGTGSSLERKKYLSMIKNIKEESVKLGAKGTDLFINLPTGKISIAEAQMLQSFIDAKKETYGSIFLQDIVSGETEKSLDEMWNKLSIINKNISNKELLETSKSIKRFKKSQQYYIPSIDSEKKEISFNRMAPGGHALFGVDGLIAAYKDDLRPKSENLTLISSIGNGEDLGSSPDKYMVSWMLSKKIPVAMVTTTKTKIDLKGGQIAISAGDSPYVTMVEKAQAEKSNQLNLFYKLGLDIGNNEAFFNTNMVLINYEVLSPMIKNLVKEIGEDEFLKVITPDLIQNIKEQTDKDGIKRKYIQLEGAMGSTFLNLDRYWRKKYKTPIVHFLNVDTDNRTKFFSPIKTAFDFFMQTLSDRFKFNSDNFCLEYLSKKELPSIDLVDPYYKALSNVLTLFKNTNILDLSTLRVKGIVDFSNVTLSGKVVIENNSKDIINLNSTAGALLQNISISIDSSGNLSSKKL